MFAAVRVRLQRRSASLSRKAGEGKRVYRLRQLSYSLVKQRAACAANSQSTTSPFLRGRIGGRKTGSHFSCQSSQSSAGPDHHRARASTSPLVSFSLLARARTVSPKGDGAPRRRCNRGHGTPCPARRARRAHPDDARVRASRRPIAALFLKSRAALPSGACMRSSAPHPVYRPACDSRRRPVVMPVGGSPRPPEALVR